MTHVISKSGLNVHREQVFEPAQGKHETIIIPSTSSPAWGSYFVCDLRMLNVIVHDLALQFNVSAISGLTGSVANYPNYTPAYKWIQRLELAMNDKVIDTYYPDEQFIMNQLFVSDEKRRLNNNSCGAYDSLAQRNTLATATSNYFVNLFNCFQQAHIPLLFAHSNIQLRVYMDTLANNVNQSTLTGTPVSTINSCNLIAKISRMSQDDLQARKVAVAKNPHHYRFTELRYGTFTVQSGVSSASIVLNPIVGPVSFLLFTVRPTNALTGNSGIQYTAISNFAILDNTGTNVTGGQVIPSAMALQVLGKDWSLSSYLGETAIGLTDNKANVYMFSFASDPIETVERGISTGSYHFRGSEQLQIAFTGSLASAVQVDLYALCDSVLEVSGSGIRKLSA